MGVSSPLGVSLDFPSIFGIMEGQSRAEFCPFPASVLVAPGRGFFMEIDKDYLTDTV